MHYYSHMYKLKRWQTRPLLFVVLFALLSFVSVLYSTTRASAATRDVPNLLYSDKVYKDLSAHQHYWWLYACFRGSNIDNIEKDEMAGWDFFEGVGINAYLGDMYDGEGGKHECEDGGIVKTAFGYLGATDPRAAYCSLDKTFWDGDGNYYDDETCRAAPGDGTWDMDGNVSEQAATYKSNFESKKPTLTPEAQYMRAYSSLMQGCDISLDDQEYATAGEVPGADDGNGNKYAVPIVVEPNPGEFEVKYKLGIGLSGDNERILVANSDVGDSLHTKITCNQLVNIAREYADDYAVFLARDGYDADTGEGGTTGSVEPVCSAGALGWVICPAMSLMADVIQWVAGTLEGYLTFNPFAGENNDIKRIWSSLLNVANSLLVVAFLVVVFSQSTSLGLSNYGIKRMLPRIIAAAILMNLSYYICQILVDLSNIAGVGVTSLVAATTDGTFADNVEQVSGLSKVIVGAGIIAVVAFFFLIPVLLSFLAIIFTIAARNALIVLLVIVAPLAFAAWIFPNTEKYFKKWWELLVNMLLLFPLVMLMFAASVVAANVISSATPPSGTGGQELQGIIALLVLSLPLFAMPFLFKIAGGALGKINDMTKQQMNKGIQSDAAKWTGRRAKFGALSAGAAGRAGLRKASGGKYGDPKKPGRITRGYRNVRAFDKQIDSTLDARKRGREETIQERATEIGASKGLIGASIRGVGGARYGEIMGQQIADAFGKRVQAIEIGYQRGGEQGADTGERGYLAMQWQQAIDTNNQEQASAVLNRLSALGVSGRARATQLIQDTVIPTTDGDTGMRDAVSKSIYQDNYSALVANRAEATKGSYDDQGKWSPVDDKGVHSYSKISTANLATQDYSGLSANREFIPAAEAYRIIHDARLSSTVDDQKTLDLFTEVARGYTPPAGTPSPLSGNTPPPQPPRPIPNSDGGRGDVIDRIPNDHKFD